MHLTNSKVRAFQRCKRQYDYKFKHNLVPKRNPLPLKRGSWLHELLEAHYLGGDWREKNKELATQFLTLFEEEREMYGDLPDICFKIMRAYEYRWKEEDAGLKVIEVEKEFEVELPHGHILQGKVDGIVEDEWGMWLLEHKSHKSLPKDDYRFIDMQSARYVWGLQQVGYPVVGVLWNYLCTVEPRKPKLTQAGRLSKAKLRTDPITFVETIQEYGLDPRDYKDDIVRLKNHDTFFRRDRVSRPKKVVETLVKEAVVTGDEIERGYLPIRSIDRSCEMFCSYLDLCMTSLYGGDTKSIVHAKYQRATKEDYYGITEKEYN